MPEYPAIHASAQHTHTTTRPSARPNGLALICSVILRIAPATHTPNAKRASIDMCERALARGLFPELEQHNIFFGSQIKKRAWSVSGMAPRIGSAACFMLHSAVLFISMSLVRAQGTCSVPIGGIFQFRRSPAGLQREAAARAAFCEFFGACSPGYNNFNPSNPTSNSAYVMWANDTARGLNVTYYVLSESSASSNSDLSEVVKEAIELILNNMCVAFLGPNSSSTSKAASPLATVYKPPHISYAATSSELSDKATYPQFFRTPPSDSGQARGIVAFIKHIGWTNLCVINSLDTYGATGAAAVVSEAKAEGLTVATQQEFFAGETSATTLQGHLQKIQATNVRIVVVFMLDQDAINMLKQAIAMQMYGKGWVWISSDSFTGIDFATHGIDAVGPGFIGLDQAAGYTNAVNTAFQVRWNATYNRPNKIITNYRSLSSTYTGLSTAGNPINYASYGSTFNSYAYFSYDAMLILLTAIRNLADKGSTPCTHTLEDYRTNLTAELRNTSVSGLTGTVSFNSKQDRDIAFYDARNFDGTSWSTWSTWSASSSFAYASGLSASNAPQWASGDRGTGNAPVDQVTPTINDYDYKAHRAAFLVLTCIMMVVILVTSTLTIRYRAEPAMKAASPKMLLLINVGAMLVLLAIALGYPDPTNGLCVAQNAIGHVGFALSFGSLFAKNWRVKRIFYDQIISYKVDLTDLALMKPIGLVLTVSVVYMCAWFAVDPPKRGFIFSETDSSLRYAVCKSDQNWWYYALYIVEICFLLVGVVIAWQVRNVADRFNESKPVGMSLYALLFISAIMLGLLANVNMDPDTFYAAISMAVIVCTGTIQGLLFVPRLLDVRNDLDPFLTKHPTATSPSQPPVGMSCTKYGVADAVPDRNTTVMKPQAESRTDSRGPADSRPDSGQQQQVRFALGPADGKRGDGETATHVRNYSTDIKAGSSPPGSGRLEATVQSLRTQLEAKSKETTALQAKVEELKSSVMQLMEEKLSSMQEEEATEATQLAADSPPDSPPDYTAPHATTLQTGLSDGMPS